MWRNMVEQIGGRAVLGTPFVGLLAAQILAETATGADGLPGLMFNDGLVDGKRYSLRLQSAFGADGFVWENGSWRATAPASTTYLLYEDNLLVTGGAIPATVGAVTSVSIAAAITGAITGAVAAACTVSNTSTPVDVTVTAAIAGAIVGTVSAATTVENAPTLATGKRKAPVGLSTAPVKLQRMDWQEVDDIAFEHGAELLAGETITTASVTAELHMGADPAPSQVLQYAAQVSGTNVIQRVRGQVPGATYMLRCLATLSSGRQLVGAAILPIVKLR